MGVAEQFYEAFMVRDHYTMGLLYAENATFSDPVFPLLNARGARMMWNMLLTRAEDLGIEVNILDDGPSRASVDWVAHYNFGATGRPVVNRVHTEMALSNGRIVRQVDRFNLWRWSGQALGASGWLLGWTPLVRNKIRTQAARSLREYARKASGGDSSQETR
jgi:hypothetical protein